MSSNERHYVTRSGLSAQLLLEGEQKAPMRDSWEVWFTIRTPGNNKERACVRLLSPMIMKLQLEAIGAGTFEDNKQKLAILALLDNLDGLSELPADPYGNREIAVGSEDVEGLLRRPRQSDRDIRRFLARRVYDGYSRSTLREHMTLDAMDIAICGASDRDVMRNSQLLEEEGYLFIRASAPGSITIEPRAKLVREVERYGAARDDAAGEADFISSMRAYSSLATVVEAVLLEYGRYTTARTAVELDSVFRAVAPIVEKVVKDVLLAGGSSSQHSSLGPAINDMRQRHIGNIGLWAELSHVLKFTRDLSQHGTSLPEPVLRIACENCFQLLPQLAALYPTSRGPVV